MAVEKERFWTERKETEHEKAKEEEEEGRKRGR